jgi:hypothetical protein
MRRTKLVKKDFPKRKTEKELQREELEKLFGDPGIPIWEKRLMARAFRDEYGK